MATPIGNLGDIVPRAVTTLQQVDIIACEDTRHSKKLLNHLNIQKPLIAYHDHDEQQRSDEILALLEAGKDIALISDAGTPLISDPGYRLVQQARQCGFDVSPLPGPCAAIAALSASGLPSHQFTFIGFPPAKASGRKKWLEGIAQQTATLILYEAPHRIVETLQQAVEILGGERDAVLGRELTKTFETFLSGSLKELAEQVASDPNQQRGEIVLMIAGASAPQSADDQEQQRILTLLMEELPVKKAAALTAKITGGDRRDLYQLGVSLKSPD